MDGNNGVLSVSLAQMMPGLWLMAISPVFVGLYPTVLGSCLWQVVMTVGECLWSPRQLSWVASLAPNGLEGLFFAIASARCKRYAAMLLITMTSFTCSLQFRRHRLTSIPSNYGTPR